MKIRTNVRAGTSSGRCGGYRCGGSTRCGGAGRCGGILEDTQVGTGGYVY